MRSAVRLLLTSQPLAILLGSILISLSILLSGGIIRLKDRSTVNAAVPAPSALGVQATVAPSMTPLPKVDITLGHLPIKGSDTAKVALVEFADFRCPFCGQWFSQTEPQIIKNYVDSGKIKLAFRHFQFLGDPSVKSGNAAECANEQNKFWDYHDYLYKNQPSESDTSMYTIDKLTSIAENLGLSSGQFKSCLDSTKYSKNVSDDQSEGSKVGITGTPTFVIGKLDSSGNKIVSGTLLVGAQPYSQFQSTIDPLLSNK